MTNKITLNGIEYIPVSEINNNIPAETFEGMEYCIVRGDRSGVFAGYIESQNGKDVVIRKARRIWYWDGAASISDLAEHGTSKPGNCKFPVEVSKIIVTDAIEIINATEKAKLSIASVAVWTKSL